MKIYLDMDGVLANLFDYISMILCKRLYKDLNEEEKDAIRKVWQNKKSFFSFFPPMKELFSKLEPFPTNDALISTVVNKFGGFYICTCPSELDREGCIEGKTHWIEKNIASKYKDSFLGVIFAKNKAHYALDDEGNPNILIDDYAPYVNNWKEAGGIGIKLQSSDFSSDDEIVEYIEKSLSTFLKK